MEGSENNALFSTGSVSQSLRESTWRLKFDGAKFNYILLPPPIPSEINFSKGMVPTRTSTVKTGEVNAIMKRN